MARSGKVDSSGGHERRWHRFVLDPVFQAFGNARCRKRFD